MSLLEVFEQPEAGASRSMARRSPGSPTHELTGYRAHDVGFGLSEATNSVPKPDGRRERHCSR